MLAYLDYNNLYSLLPHLYNNLQFTGGGPRILVGTRSENDLFTYCLVIASANVLRAPWNRMQYSSSMVGYSQLYLRSRSVGFHDLAALPRIDGQEASA